MAQVAGIKFIKDANNNNRFVTIDLKKHGEMFKPLLQKVGALENDFEKDWNDAISGEEFWNEIKETIHIHFKDKGDTDKIHT